MDFTSAQDSIRSFARDRDWEQFHTPRNLLLALTGEVGELAAEMQWKADDNGHRPLNRCTLCAPADGRRSAVALDVDGDQRRNAVASRPARHGHG